MTTLCTPSVHNCGRPVKTCRGPQKRWWYSDLTARPRTEAGALVLACDESGLCRPATRSGATFKESHAKEGGVETNGVVKLF